jgi:hypothetical protein
MKVVRMSLIVLFVLSLVACGNMPMLTPEVYPTVSDPIVTPHPASDSNGCPKTLPSFPNATKLSEQQPDNWHREATYLSPLEPSAIFDSYTEQLLPVGWKIISTSNNSIKYRYAFYSAILNLDISMISNVPDGFQYLVGLTFGAMYEHGLDKHCSHLYP